MTFDELIERAKRLAGVGSGSPDLWAAAEIHLAALKDLAMHDLAVEVMRNSSQRALFQQDYEVPLDAIGAGDLLTAPGSVTSAADILLEGVEWGVVRDADGNVLQRLAHYLDLQRPQPTVFGYYCLTGQTIQTRAKDAAWSSSLDAFPAASPLTVRASFAPVNLIHVPLELEDDLVRHLVRVAVMKVAEANAAAR